MSIVWLKSYKSREWSKAGLKILDCRILLLKPQQRPSRNYTDPWRPLTSIVAISWSCFRTFQAVSGGNVFEALASIGTSEVIDMLVWFSLKVVLFPIKWFCEKFQISLRWIHVRSSTTMEIFEVRAVSVSMESLSMTVHMIPYLPFNH